ncbi:hypothetical protein CANINC_002131 [Pichia inconspicua]|uniref:Uncharacterized protein n=1 Tax=Pichia inconspicua TaxID=52247 RepID=A0A4T0X2G8_9ASCO|nr:hypothetical protein CANINC_002131 [[Candida] inconspicua]
MPSDEFQQLVQLIDLKGTSDVLIESTNRLYDSTLRQPYFNDKIETQAGVNAEIPPVRRQTALRVKKSDKTEDQFDDRQFISNTDPIMKFAGKEVGQKPSNDVTTNYSNSVKYGHSKPDNLIFKQFDQSSPTTPKQACTFVSFPDQPNVKVALYQENSASNNESSEQLDSYLRNLKFVVNTSNDLSSISKIKEHYAHLTSATPITYDFGEDENGNDYNHDHNHDTNPKSISTGSFGHTNDRQLYNDDDIFIANSIEEKESTKLIYFDQDSLEGAKVVNKTLKLNAGFEFTWFDTFWRKLISTFRYVRQNNLKLLFEEWGHFDVDVFYEKVFRVQVSLTPLFSTISRMASLLFVYDTIKNTLCKQKTILPMLREDMRIAVCRNLEEYSTRILSKLTDLIKYEYLSRNTNQGAQWEVLFSGFVMLSACTVLHYNSGYRQSMSIEQSKKCVDFIGTFTAGIYSMIINQDEEANKDPYNYLRNYSRFLMLYTKLIIVPNYNSELFTELFNLLKSLNLNKIPNIKKKSWSSCYIDLYIFLEKHSYFLKVYRDHNDILGFERGYVVRLINEWYQIFPHDLINIGYLDVIDEESEILALIHLTFLAVRYYLEALIPGIRSFIRNSFAGGEKFGYDSAATLMKVFSLLTTEKNRFYAMYMIRFATFFSLRFHGVKSLLKTVYIPEISDPKEMTNTERCESLFKYRKYGNIICEVQKLTMLTSRGSIIQEQNYPSYNELGKSANNFEPAKTYKFKSIDETLEDFTKTNSGLLSVDYDPRTEKLESITSTFDKVKIKENDNSERKNTLAAIDHTEVDTSIMKNCWALETQIKMSIK